MDAAKDTPNPEETASPTAAASQAEPAAQAEGAQDERAAQAEPAAKAFSAQAEPAAPAANAAPYLQNRELSWLTFNERVLDQGADETVPLLERLNFVSIFWSNLQEFFMVRVGSLTDLSLVKKHIVDSKSGMTPSEQLDAIYARTSWTTSSARGLPPTCTTTSCHSCRRRSSTRATPSPTWRTARCTWWCA